MALSPLRTIYRQTMSRHGFMWKLRENEVDEAGFEQLVASVRELAQDTHPASRCIDRRLVAFLFEVPWEIENTVDHYRSRDPELGRRVGQMADAVRGVLHELLWIGLEDYDGLVDNPNLEPWECG